MEPETNKKRIKITKKQGILIASILVALVIIIGTSYAWWSFTDSQRTINRLTSDCLELELIDENPIDLQKAYPITDEEAKGLTPYTFTIKNKCNMSVSYITNLEVMDVEDRLSSEYIDLQINDQPFKLLKDHNVAVESYYKNKNGDNYTVAEKYVLGNGTLTAKDTAGDSNTYSIKLWVDEDVTVEDDAMNKNFISKVTIMADLNQTEFAMTDISANYANQRIKIDYTAIGDGIRVSCKYGTDENNLNNTCSNITATSAEIPNPTKGQNYYYQVCLVNKQNQQICETGKENAENNLVEYIKNKANSDESIVKTDHEATEQLGANTDYRYIGANPDNYVCFGSEESPCPEANLYRIIGVIPTQKTEGGVIENRVKLIKAKEYIQDYWSGSSASDNDWTKSTLNTEKLNGTYWTTIGINYQNYIEDSLWYLGAPSSGDTINDFYKYERSNQAWRSYKTNYVAKIGLMYTSEVGVQICSQPLKL